MPDPWHSSIRENVQTLRRNRISRCKDGHKFILERDKLIKPYGNRDKGTLGQNLPSYPTGHHPLTTGRRACSALQGLFASDIVAAQIYMMHRCPLISETTLPRHTVKGVKHPRLHPLRTKAFENS